MSLVPYPGKLFFSGWSSRFGILTSLLKIRLFCKLIQKLICSECFVEIQSYSINPLVKILLMPLFLAHIIYSAGFLLQLEKKLYKVSCLDHFIWLQRTAFLSYFSGRIFCVHLIYFWWTGKTQFRTLFLPLAIGIPWFGPPVLSVLPRLERKHWSTSGFMVKSS